MHSLNGKMKKRLKRVRSGDWVYYYAYRGPLVDRRHVGRARLSHILKLGRLRDLFYVARTFFFAEGVALKSKQEGKRQRLRRQSPTVSGVMRLMKPAVNTVTTSRD